MGSVSAPLFQPHVVRFGVLVNQCCSCCSSLSTTCQYLCYLTKLFQWEWGLFEAVCLDSFGEFFTSLRKNICSGFFFLSLSLNQEVKFNISLSQDKSHLQFSLFLIHFPPPLLKLRETTRRNICIRRHENLFALLFDKYLCIY